ncbi:MAG: EamA family transporter RarD [Alphaproteobacteria bacterium]
MTPRKSEHLDSRAGILLAGGTYTIWGVIPVYWRLLDAVPPFEIVVHRVLWCAVFMAIFIVSNRRLMQILKSLRGPRVFATLALTSILIAVNWGLFIWSVATNRLVEASLGYYTIPLVSIALGILFLGERQSALRIAAIVLAGVAVAVQTIALGRFPWLALTLAVTFGAYGYLRKTVNMGAVDGLFVESILLFPPALALIVYWAASGSSSFLSISPFVDSLLILAGPLTAIPLAMFSAGARRVRLSTLGFLQYIGPSIALVLATAFWGERFTWIHAVTFGCVWLALVLVALEHHPRLKRAEEIREAEQSLPRA